MKACEGKVGRVFVLRLEDGDEMPGSVEQFARDNQVRHGFAFFVGGIGDGEIVVGPRKSNARPPKPMTVPIEEAHECTAIGLLAPDGEGNPVLHIHGSFGRKGTSLTGCLRPGVKTWLVGEVVLYEITGVEAARLADGDSGMALLTLGATAEAPAREKEQEAPAPAPTASAPAAASAPEEDEEEDEPEAPREPGSAILFAYRSGLN